MALKVETFVDPAKDPRLKRSTSGARRGYRAVDFHRVTADNAAGPEADSGRTVRFAPDADAARRGQGIEARFSCDALEFEWLPTETTTPTPGTRSAATCARTARRSPRASRPGRARPTTS